TDPLDESSWDTLTRLAKNLDKHDRLAEVYGEALAETGVDEPVTAKLATITGRLHEEKTGDLALAAQFYRSALEFNPADLPVFEALAGVYRREEEWEALVTLHRGRVEVAESDDERRELLHVMAQVSEREKSEADAAVDLYREVLELDREDARAIDELDRLLTQGERWQDLVEHVRHRIDIALGSEDEVPLKHRLGELLVDRLDDRGGALDVFEEITDAAPSFAPTVAKLEQMVTAVENRLRITQLLEPIYRGADEWRKLVAIFEAQVELGDDPSEQVRLLGEIGRLHEERGRDGVLAFTAWSRAFVLEPHDQATRAELDRLATLLEAWDQQVAAYEAAVAAADDPTLVTELLTVVAGTHDKRRGDPRSAIETYERILVHDSEVVEPLSQLEQLHMMVGDWLGLVDVIGRRVERVYDAEERGELLRRQASVLEELIGDRDGAIEAYEKATVENDTDEIALEGLDRLYTAAGNSDKLGEILARRLAVETDSELRVEVAMRLGTLLETQLSRPEDAIDAFNRVLDDDAQNMDAIVCLARLYERQAMWPDLLGNIRLRAGMAEDDSVRVELTHRAGEVLERELDDVHEALAMYEEALSLDGHYPPTFDALLRIANLADYRERAAEILEPRLEIQERWDDLASLLTLLVEAESDPMGRRDRLRRIAGVHEQGRSDLDAAFDALSRALAEDPADPETADELERVGVMLGAHDRVADALSARASSVLDPTVASLLFTRLARIAEENLGNDQRAIEAYARASEQVGDDDALLAALDRLYAKTEAFSELAGVLERRIGLSNDPEERNGFLLRLGTVKETHHGDLRGAFNAYQEVLESEPTDMLALQSMERLADDEGLAAEVVETLDSVYRQTGATEKVADLYDVRIRLADSDGERARLLIEAASIYETELGRGDRALDAVRRAFELDPRDQSLLDDVERLAGATGGWESMRGLVERVTESGDVEQLVAKDLNLRAATWYHQHLGDAEAAEARLRAAIDADPESGDGYEALIEILEVAGREADLVASLMAWAAVELDETLKKERLSRSAQMADSALGDAHKAMECYQAILAFEPADLPTLAELTVLVAAEERWDEVASLLARRIDAEPDPQTRLAVRHDLASVHLGKREAASDAVDAYRGVLDEDPTDLTAIDALEGLYETEERWEDLAELLERRLDVAQNQAEQITARVRLARLSEQRFGRREEAMEQLRAILEMDSQNGDALDELERLLGLDSKWDELVELLDRRANDAAAAAQSDVEVDILLRLAAVQEDQLGDDAQAMATNQRVLDKSPHHEGALRALLELHEKADDWESVAKDLVRIIGVSEGEEAIAAAYRLADVATSKLEDMAQAESALRAAYALDPSRGESGTKLKAHYEAQEQWDELALILADEEASAPDDAAKVALLKEIASIYEERLGDPGQAAEHLERASHLTPDDREVLLPLCDLYIAAGRSADAIP
ncbi:MAG: hypothetical protein JRH11_18830, partial [Deltaproteobacteria bacterium]|nr:hypothetical protein [Deltaproteobacteria bacterium]